MNRIILTAAASIAAFAMGMPGAQATADLSGPTPTKAHPIVQVSEGTKTVTRLRITYLESITNTYSYAQYNSGAAQLVFNCKAGRTTQCARPHRGEVILEDGSKVGLARWVR